MNVGYNSCTVGAKKIREIEKKENYNIPWTIFLDLNTQNFLGHCSKYQSVISQGETLGIYTWLLFPGENSLAALSLVQEHPDSAFLLFCKAQEITQALTDTASRLKNLMIVVRYDEKNSAGACRLLREKQLLYSIFFCYKDADIKSIASGDLFSQIQLLHPVFTILVAAPECTVPVRMNVYETVKHARNLQSFQTILWEGICDTCFIDGIISNDSCLVNFDSKGQLLTLQGEKTGDCFNLFQKDLSGILKEAFPKSNSSSFSR